MTDDQLRQAQENAQKRLGIVRDVPGLAIGEPPVDAPPCCASCGLPIPGLPPARIKVKVRCGSCIKAAKEREAAEAEAAQAQALAHLRESLQVNPAAILGPLGVPPLWREACFGQCPDIPAQITGRAASWSRKPDGMAYLYGPPGSGKTWVAVAMLRAVLEAGHAPPSQCLFVGEAAYLDILRAAINDPEPRRHRPANHPLLAALLVYDDAASTRLTDWGRGEVAQLIERRHATGLPTIITSNLDPAGLARALDPRVVSRVAESRHVWGFPAKDLRLTGSVPPNPSLPAPAPP
jgi:hypothetical protein